MPAAKACRQSSVPASVRPPGVPGHLAALRPEPHRPWTVTVRFCPRQEPQSRSQPPCGDRGGRGGVLGWRFRGTRAVLSYRGERSRRHPLLQASGRGLGSADPIAIVLRSDLGLPFQKGSRPVDILGTSWGGGGWRWRRGRLLRGVTLPSAGQCWALHAPVSLTFGDAAAGTGAQWTGPCARGWRGWRTGGCPCVEPGICAAEGGSAHKTELFPQSLYRRQTDPTNERALVEYP